MKRIRTIPLLLVFPLLSAGPLSGQFAVGFSVGQTNSTVASSRLGDLEQTGLTGYTAGFSATLDLHRHFGVTVGLARTQKGASYVLPGWVVDRPDLPDGTLSYQRTYTEISVLARAMAPLWDRKVSVYALAGPAVDMANGCEVEFRAGIGPSAYAFSGFPNCLLPDQRGVIGLAEQYDLGAVGGIGGDVAIPWGMRLSAEVLYTFGLRSDGLNCEDVENRTRTLQFGLAYALR